MRHATILMLIYGKSLTTGTLKCYSLAFKYLLDYAFYDL